MITKYKLIKDIPNHKIGGIVQFFGSVEDEPYTSMVKKTQYTPDVAWYWKDNTDRGECHITNYNLHCRCEWGNIDMLPEYFAPYLFTTDDNCEVFEGDSYTILHKRNNVIEVIKHAEGLCIAAEEEWDTDNYFFFSTKEKAEEYLASLQEFKLGDIVVYTRENIITQYKEGLAHPSWFRKATNDEVIEYNRKNNLIKEIGGYAYLQDGEIIIP